MVNYLTMLKDATSIYYVPSRIVGSITAASNAPLYSWFVTEIGTGMVGGSFFDVDHDAEQAAAMAGRILSGEAVQKIPPERGTFRTVVG